MPSESWTKHHFETVAWVLIHNRPPGKYGSNAAGVALWERTVRMFANYFESANHRFRRSVFLRACGMDGTAILEDQQERAKEQVPEGSD